MPTALQLAPDAWQQYLTARPERRDVRKQADTSQRDSIMHEVRIAAERIKSKLGAKRVLLIGSLAHGLWWEEESDVDLVVEGLSGSDYWEAWAIAEEMITGRQIEVIDLESATPSLRRRIETEGIRL